MWLKNDVENHKNKNIFKNTDRIQMKLWVMKLYIFLNTITFPLEYKYIMMLTIFD